MPLQDTSIEKGNSEWNIAEGYTQLKILKPSVELDNLVMRAKYGTEEQLEQPLPYDIKTQRRIEALNRLIDTFRTLFENSHFAMRKKLTQEKLEGLQKRVTEVENVIDAITYQTSDERTGQIQGHINESHFNLCLNKLRQVKLEINKPLNDNNLIFHSSDEIDLDKIKQKLIEDG
jgi:hypothetical protein